MTDTISRSIRSVRENIAARCDIVQSDDDAAIQNVQVDIQADETDTYQRYQNYGFNSNPPAGLDAIVSFPNGERLDGIVLGIGDAQYRVKADVGAVVIYTDEGDEIHLKRGNQIEIKTNSLTINASDNVTVNTGTFTVNASDKVARNTPIVEASGKVAAKQSIEDYQGQGGQTMNKMREIYNAHKHTEQGDHNATTTPDRTM